MSGLGLKFLLNLIQLKLFFFFSDTLLSVGRGVGFGVGLALVLALISVGFGWGWFGLRPWTQISFLDAIASLEPGLVAQSLG